MLVVRVRPREKIVPFLFGGRVFDHDAAKRILLLPSMSLEPMLQDTIQAFENIWVVSSRQLRVASNVFAALDDFP
jgi:hypothetical protein